MSDDKLIRYVTRDMTLEERAEFERQLREDAGLREQLDALLAVREAAHDWFDAPAPGAELVEQLVLPDLPGRPQYRLIRVFAQAAAAIVLFAGGFALGTHRAPSPAGQASAIPSVGPAAPQVRAPTPTTVVATPAATPEPAGIPEPIYTQKENGRVVVQTTLRSSGARATWVVDGGFQIAQSATTNNSERIPQ